MAPEVPRLGVKFEYWDGTSRFGGPDERDPWWRIVDGSFDTEMPGGFGPGRIVFARPSGWDQFDGALLADATVTDQEGRNVYEGRVTGVPKTSSETVEVQTEGWFKSTEDDKTATEIFRNIDLTRWGPPSAAYRLSKGQAPYYDSEVQPDPSSGLPQLELKLSDEWDTTYGPATSDALFDAGAANRISLVYFEFLKRYWDANMTLYLFASSGDASGFEESSGNWGASSGSGEFDIQTPRRFLMWELLYAVTAGTPGVEHGTILRNMAVYGDHELERRGSEPNAGFFVSDLAPYVVKRWCPALEVAPDSIEQTSFIVTHSDFPDRTTPRAMLDTFALFGGNSFLPLDMGVYDGKRFFMKSPGTYGREWRARLDTGADPSDQGADASERLNGIVVQYNPGDGSTLAVGPPGSGADLETSDLLDGDPDHPFTRRGLRNWDVYDAGIVGQPGAILVGRMILADANRKKWRGSVKLKGTQKDKAGNPHPPYMVRSGDHGVIEDDTPGERRIIGTSYDFRSGEASVSAGADPDRLPALLARANISVVGKGV